MIAATRRFLAGDGPAPVFTSHKAVSSVIGEWMPAATVMNRRVRPARRYDLVEHLWCIAIMLEQGHRREGRAELGRVWAALVKKPTVMPTATSRAFVVQTAAHLRSRHRPTSALGERGRRLVLGILLRPFRNGGKTGRPLARANITIPHESPRKPSRKSVGM
jgi:hypothetical protein